jgi:flavin-binding protein dodecin
VPAAAGSDGVSLNAHPATGVLGAIRDHLKEATMSSHTYKLVELAGSSPTSIEDAVQTAIARASKTLRNIHWFQIIETRGSVAAGKIEHWQVMLKVGFTLEE